MDCAFCYYPNEDDTRFCVRCAAALGVAEDRLPSEAPPAPNGLIADGTQRPGAGAVDPHLLGDRYRIVRCLGTGGFGSVYEAEEVDSGLRVAVKVLHHTALVDARMRERFLQEARMIAKLRSPHVVRLYDFAVTPAAARNDTRMSFFQSRYGETRSTRSSPDQWSAAEARRDPCRDRTRSPGRRQAAHRPAR